MASACAEDRDDEPFRRVPHIKKTDSKSPVSGRARERVPARQHPKASGAVDAISFLALGKVFSAFMTGNIGFLGLRIAGAGAPGAVAILVSMPAFAVGVYVSTRIV